jgi:hypothetical protein
MVKTDNIFDVERDVISNATGKRHRNQAGCTIDANYRPFRPSVARAVLHRQDLAKEGGTVDKEFQQRHMDQVKSAMRFGSSMEIALRPGGGS